MKLARTIVFLDPDKGRSPHRACLDCELPGESYTYVPGNPACTRVWNPPDAYAREHLAG